MVIAIACVSLLSGCFRDLDIAICQKDPTNAVCFASDASNDSSAETSAVDATSDASSGNDAHDDGSVDSNVVPDATTDGAAVDARDTAVDGGVDASATDTASVDAGPQDGLLTETSVDAGAAPTCADVGVTVETCGNCGARRRTCLATGVWSDWGACESEGVCSPNETSTVTGDCPGVLEKRSRTCTASCAWDVGTCALPKGWTALPFAPIAGRIGYSSSAVWTGSRMLVFGGSPFGTAEYANDGASYELATNTWSMIKAEQRRLGHRAVWDGTRMIVWGGYDTSTTKRADGAKYDPATDSWSSVAATTLVARSGHAGVWSTTTNRFLVWGGSDASGNRLDDGAAYDPATNTWEALPAAPISGRTDAVAAWTGTEMLVWGGSGASGFLSDGAVYEPISRSWRKLPATTLTARSLSAVAATATKVVIYGGIPGGKSDGASALLGPTLSWASIASPGTLLGARVTPAAWFDGTRLGIWSGGTASTDPSDGAFYSVDTDSWSAIPATNVMPPRHDAFAVWTGRAAIIWGGIGEASPGAPESGLHTGALFVP